jgi:hypothetical protein
MPIAQAGPDHPLGFPIAGLSTRRGLDEAYALSTACGQFFVSLQDDPE